MGLAVDLQALPTCWAIFFAPFSRPERVLIALGFRSQAHASVCDKEVVKIVVFFRRRLEGAEDLSRSGEILSGKVIPSTDGIKARPSYILLSIIESSHSEKPLRYVFLDPVRGFAETIERFEGFQQIFQRRFIETEFGLYIGQSRPRLSLALEVTDLAQDGQGVCECP